MHSLKVTSPSAITRRAGEDENLPRRWADSVRRDAMPTWLPWTTILTEALKTVEGKGLVEKEGPLYGLEMDQRLPGMDTLMLEIEKGAQDPQQAPPVDGDPEFLLVRVSDSVLLGFVYRLEAMGGKVDLEFLEYVVRRGCRGHRNLFDAQGRAIPSQMETDQTGEILLSRSTYASYELSGVGAALVIMIMHRPSCLER